ncbi:MAG: VOC family protein [Dehalococcoidia bacterium]
MAQARAYYDQSHAVSDSRQKGQPTAANESKDVTPYLCADGAAEAIEFYRKAFGAEETFRMAEDDGRIGHAELMIGASPVFISDEAPELGVLSPKKLAGSATSMVLKVGDADAAFQRAIDAGATVQRPLSDEFYGRSGWLVDPFGHRWNIYKPAEDQA